MAQNFRRYQRNRCSSAPTNAAGWEGGFPTKETPYRPGVKRIGGETSFEPPFRPGKAQLHGNGSSMDQRLIAREPSEDRRGKRMIEVNSGSLSERPFRPCMRILPKPPEGKVAPVKGGVKRVDHLENCTDDIFLKWKAGKHRPTVLSAAFIDSSHPFDGWKPSKASGKYAYQAEWIPPFRDYEGEAPRRFYSIFPGAVPKPKDPPAGKRKSEAYNTVLKSSLGRSCQVVAKHIDESKKFLGGKKTSFEGHHTQWPFVSLPPTKSKKIFSDHTHVNHHEGVGTLLNPVKDYDYNAYIYL